MRFLHLLLILIFTYVSAGPNDRYLSLPNPEKCKNRFKEFQYDGRNYFYSGHDKELKDAQLDWLDARNTCRERCMETVSLETQAEFEFIKEFIEKKEIKFVWTSGRLCDFAGCEGRWDLLPKIIKGWLWSNNQMQIDDTNKIPKGWTYTPWSRTGHLNRTQPDNAEFFINQATESCIGVLNNKYNDSVTWHDIACYHKTGFICEDSAELILEAQEVKESSDTSEEIVVAAPPRIETTRLETSTLKPGSQKSVATTNRQTTTRQAATTTIQTSRFTTTSTGRTTEASTSKLTTTTSKFTTEAPRRTSSASKATTSSEEPPKRSSFAGRSAARTSKPTPPDAFSTTVTSRFRVGRTRTSAEEIPQTSAKTTQKPTTSSSIFKQSWTTTAKPEEFDIFGAEEPESVTVNEDIMEKNEIPELILNLEEIMPFEITTTTELPKTTTQKPVIATKKISFKRRKPEEPRTTKASLEVKTTTAELEAKPTRKPFLQRKKILSEPHTVRTGVLSRNELKNGPQVATNAEISDSTSTEEPRSTKKYSFKRKKIYGKLEADASTEQPFSTSEQPISTTKITEPTTTSTLKLETSPIPEEPLKTLPESSVVISNNQGELQNIEEVTQESSTAQEVIPEEVVTQKPEEPAITRKNLLIRKNIIASSDDPDQPARAIPIRRKNILIPKKIVTNVQETDEQARTIPLVRKGGIIRKEIVEDSEQPEDPERALPIKRKKVKIYRKVIKLRTSTEKVLFDGPLQSIDESYQNGEYAATVVPPIPIRRNLFKPKFRPSRIRFTESKSN